jgi:hypothetical protein
LIAFDLKGLCLKLNRSLVEFETVWLMQRILKIAEQRLAQGTAAVAALNRPMASAETASVRPTPRNVVGSSTCRAGLELANIVSFEISCEFGLVRERFVTRDRSHTGCENMARAFRLNWLP